MALCVVAGAVGVWLHYRGNVEWELERDASLGGVRLFWEAIRGATPALAPGALSQLGLLGLAYAHRHPALAVPHPRPRTLMIPIRRPAGARAPRPSPCSSSPLRPAVAPATVPPTAPRRPGAPAPPPTPRRRRRARCPPTRAAGSGAAAAESAARGALLDPNTATREQLVAVPGMTAAAADALVAGRPYASMVAVNRVLAAQVPDSAARKTIYAQVWRPVDLNTASGEELLLIPGVGRKMRHEFEEYRPYRDMARFRREIGKYADSAEVARLERYVTIR
jgi:hypothetical protein